MTAQGARLRWLARGEHELPPGDDWLAPAEAARSAGHRFTKRRTEYRLRRWAGKQAVAALTGGPDRWDPRRPELLARIEVLNRPTGAPYVVVDGVPLGLDISLTDRAGWAVCLVAGAAGTAVGVDLEIVEPRSEGFVDDFLTAAEVAAVRRHPPGTERDAAANLVWSAKESALKVLRTGLRADTRSVEVTFGPAPARDDGWRPLQVDSGPRVFPGWWRRDGRFVLTVVLADGGEPPDVLAAATSDLSRAVPVHSWTAQPLVES